jgi:hypothetical protein
MQTDAEAETTGVAADYSVPGTFRVEIPRNFKTAHQAIARWPFCWTCKDERG